MFAFWWVAMVVSFNRMLLAFISNIHVCRSHSQRFFHDSTCTSIVSRALLWFCNFISTTNVSEASFIHTSGNFIDVPLNTHMHTRGAAHANLTMHIHTIIKMEYLMHLKWVRGSNSIYAQRQYSSKRLKNLAAIQSCLQIHYPDEYNQGTRIYCARI